MRALAILVAGMVLLLAIDLASKPTGAIRQDRAVEGALASGSAALGEIVEPEGLADNEAALERRERAQSAAFFIDQANLAWRRDMDGADERSARERGSAAALAVLSKLWLLGWLLAPLGALAARLACPGTQDRHPHWPMIFAATSLGVAGGLIGLALGIRALGVPAPVVLAPLVSAIVVANALLLRKHARLDRPSTLLRLAPLLIIVTVLVVLAREILLRLTILP